MDVLETFFQIIMTLLFVDTSSSNAPSISLFDSLHGTSIFSGITGAIESNNQTKLWNIIRLFASVLNWLKWNVGVKLVIVTFGILVLQVISCTYYKRPKGV